jgi:Uma2 family endonuclease
LAGKAVGETEFRIGSNRFRPDVAVLLQTRWERIGSSSSPLPEPPDIAIEVISPSESAVALDLKTASYLDAGVQEVWLLFHESEHLFIYTAESVRRLDRSSNIETPLLPGWSLAMSDLLRKRNGVYF